MTDHIRKQIRDAVETRLTGLTTTGTSVKANRFYPVQPGDLPCLRIFTPEDQAQLETHGRAQIIEMILAIQANVRTDTADDDVDRIAVEVDAAIYLDDKWGGLALQTLYSGFKLEASTAGDKEIAVGTMFYRVRYRTVQGAPTARA